MKLTLKRFALVYAASLLTAGCSNGLALGWTDTATATAAQQSSAKPIVHMVASNTPTPLLTATSTVLPVTAILPSSPTLVPASLPTEILARLPKDERGRTIGGSYIPLMNYSPTMITGKPCPRVKTWTFKVVKMPEPLQDYGISDNPCVVQNAVDDLVRTLWFYIGNNTPESMRDVERVYDTDPMNVLGVESTYRDSLIRYYREGKQVYSRCNKPLYHLIVADARTPLIANNSGEVSGQVIQISILKTTKDVSAYQCDAIAYKDGRVTLQYSVTDDMLRSGADGVAETYFLQWISKNAHWRIYFANGLPYPNYAETARALWGPVWAQYPEIFTRK